jgi:protein HOOK3
VRHFPFVLLFITEQCTRDDHYYEMQHERSRVLTQKDTLEKVYQALLEEHRALQTSHDDAVSEREDALAQVSHLRADMDNRRNDKADAYMRQEIDRLRSEL